jgi:hypothetical protein
MKSSVLSIVIFVLVSPIMAETPNGIVYNVRLENGASQWYQIVVPSSIPPANAVKWATPSLAHSNLSVQGVGIVAVGWAGGLSTRPKGGSKDLSADLLGKHYRGGKRSSCDQEFHRKRQTAGTCRDPALSPGWLSPWDDGDI